MRGWKLVGGALTVVVAGVVVWLTQLDGLEWLKHKVRGPYIDAQSAVSPSSSEFLADEKLTFVLRRASGQKVFWIFDEASVVTAGLSVQHAFPFNESLAAGDVIDHTVYAVATYQSNLQTATYRVRVRNNRFSATLIAEPDRLVMTAPVRLGTRALVGANLATFQDGQYKRFVTLAGRSHPAPGTASFSLAKPELEAVLTRAGAPPSDQLWVLYYYTAATGALAGFDGGVDTGPKRQVEMVQALDVPVLPNR
jgi:hypothetical protein